MVQITSAETEKLARVIARYSPRATVSRSAGLLTAPNLQANTLRLDVLVHHAVAYCSGKTKPGYVELGRWLNDYLGNTRIAMLEDPVEDVFVSNVTTPDGNYRVFEGTWESNDYFLQVVVDSLKTHNAPPLCLDLLQSAYALLRLSDAVAERANLHRWEIAPSNPKGSMPIAPATNIKSRARTVTFTNDDLEKLGVSRKILSPFIFLEEEKVKLRNESTGHSSLERRPLVDFGDALVLSLPHAVSPAIRRFVLSQLRTAGHLQAFQDVLAACQASQLEDEGLWELKDDTEPLTLPAPDESPMPSLHAWLLKYDTNIYLHVVLLHDRLDWLEQEGLSNFLEYPDMERAALEKYLAKVSNYCKTLLDFSEGLTLLVVGGLGRGFMIDFDGWPDNGWRWSAIRVSDVLMMAGGNDQPIKRFLKCMKQKAFVENLGIYFMNINGDFNFYCYWKRSNHQLVPREASVGSSSMITISNDFVLPVRQELRSRADKHAIQLADGRFVPVMRFNQDAYFNSVQGRPIFVSLHHIHARTLAGVVKTSRGATWLVIEPQEADEAGRRLLYEIWSGFLGLFDRLVTEAETRLINTALGALEIRLNLSKLKVPADYVETDTGASITSPVVSVNFEKRLVEIKFPSDFLVNFQQPENSGERFVIHSLAKGLVRLHSGTATALQNEESIVEALSELVIGNTGIRVLHLFNTIYPFEHLLAQQNRQPVFIAQEDVVFSKLKLSEGCAGENAEEFLKTKDECNTFLHKVVGKIVGQLRALLREFDRASVIRSVLAVCEAALQDRDHWRRTASAVIALYEPVDDVFGVATRRESDRNQISLAARTVLEMAICESPVSGSEKLSQLKRDEILAKVALLIEVATDSDAIQLQLVEPRIRLHANGEYSIDRSFHEMLVRPFLSDYLQEEFEEAAAKYSSL